MKSIYFKNFAATAAMVMASFLILGAAFVFLGRSYVINNYRESMEANADEVCRSAQALTREGALNDWSLRMTLSTLSQITGNHIFLCGQSDIRNTHPIFHNDIKIDRSFFFADLDFHALGKILAAKHLRNTTSNATAHTSDTFYLRRSQSGNNADNFICNTDRT